MRAGIPLATLRSVFITHHHSDHDADYGNLLLLAWVSGLRTRVDAWGPPPLARMTKLFLIRAHDLKEPGLVTQDENVKVTAALVDHPPVWPAFAYRFDTADRSLVISGDTLPSDRLIELARGADVLVHEALYAPGVDRLVAGLANAVALKASILSHHTTAEQAGRVAQASGVKTLVLSHLIPAEDATLTDQTWIDAARTHFRGEVIVGRDLLEI